MAWHGRHGRKGKVIKTEAQGNAGCAGQVQSARAAGGIVVAVVVVKTESVESSCSRLNACLPMPVGRATVVPLSWRCCLGYHWAADVMACTISLWR